MGRGRLGVIVVSVVWAVSVLALDPNRAVTQYTLTVWQAKDGLPQETLMCIAQTTDGELWLGAPAGLIRFDGTRFRKVPLPVGATPGDHYVNNMVADDRNGLWFSTRDGLYYLLDGVFRRWGTANGLPPGGALELALLEDGTLALATDRGVVRFDPVSGTTRAMAGLEEVSPLALTVSLGRGGRYWAGTMRGLLQLEVVSPDTPTVRIERPDEIVNAVLEDSTGRLWVGTSLGLRVTDRNGNSRRYLQGKWVRSLLEDRDGNIWIGTRGNGAYRFLDGRLDPFTVKQGLPDDLVRDLFEDRNGSVWFVTGGGLARLADGPVVAWTIREGLPVPFVWTVYEDPAGRIWAGTSGGGVILMGTEGPRRPWFSDPGLTGVEIRSFLQDSRGRFWIGTSGNGLARVAGRGAGWMRWPDNPARNRIYCLLEDGDGSIWIGTGDGLARMSESGQVTWMKDGEGDLPLTIRSLFRESGRLWVGTTAGLFVLADDRLRRVPGTEAVAMSRIHCIRSRTGGGLWLATDSGVGRLLDGRLVMVNTRRGLPNNMIYWILEDGSGNFWLSCDVGVLRVSRTGLDAVCDGLRGRVSTLVVGRLDGMPSTECNSGFPAGVRRADGSLWFPTTNGVVRIDPDQVREMEQAPSVRIESVWMDGRRVTPDDLGRDPRVIVPRGVRRIEIRYGAISLLASEKLAFRYRLAGFDPDWVPAGKSSRAVFTGLPSGVFAFEVSARHGLGSWRNPPATLTLDVTPSFAETPFFYVLVALFIILSGWLIDRVRTARLRHREKELAEQVARRTEELRVANERLAATNALLERLAVQDPLTGLANRRRLNEALAVEWKRGVREEWPITILMIDVDHFKLYNDTYGHAEGDRCLQQVAGIIASFARRPSDLAARYGGEEFVLMLPGADAASGSMIARNLLEAVREQRIPHETSPVLSMVTVSIGWGWTVPVMEAGPDMLLREADRNLYLAKRTRNTVVGPRGDGDF